MDLLTGTDGKTSLGVSEMPVDNLYEVSNFLMDKHDKLTQYKHYVVELGDEPPDTNYIMSHFVFVKPHDEKEPITEIKFVDTSECRQLPIELQFRSR